MSTRPLPRWLRPAAALAGGGVAVTLLLLLLTSCSELPTAPADAAATAGVGPSTAASGGSHKWRVEQVVGGQGGTIQLDTNLDLVFPPGALAGEVLVSAEMKLNDKKGSATKLRFDFEPSMTFLVPVTLEIGSDYLAGTGTTYVLRYFNPGSRSWEKVDEQPIGAGGSVTFHLDHFSQYSVTR